VSSVVEIVSKIGVPNRRDYSQRIPCCVETINRNDILSPTQFGFRKGYSIEMAVQLLIYDMIESIEKHKSLVLVALRHSPFERNFSEIYNITCDRLQLVSAATS
jgi:hypothetical protein